MAIRRRTLLTGAGLAAATAAVYRGVSPGPDDAAPATAGTGEPRRNILLLCIDDLNDWVGYNNAHPGVHTPHIDQLRAQAFSYNRAYCNVPVCMASRGTTLWGLGTQTANLEGLHDRHGYQALTESDTLKPLPHWFSRAGYKTLSTGKVFHFQAGMEDYWDEFQPYPELDIEGSFGEHGTMFDYGELPADEVHQDQRAANFAVEQLGRDHDRPWFMAIGLFQPHLPWRLPAWAFDLHPLAQVALPQVRAEDLDDIPAMGVELAHHPASVINGQRITQHELVVRSGLWAEHVQAYLAACSHTDAMVGQILAALDNSRYARDTAVVLWSDHGYHLGEKLHWRKMALWEQTTRVPLLVRAPWRVEAGGGFDDPVSLLDLAPTLTDLAGIPTPAQFEGQSLVGITPAAAAARPARTRWGSAVSIRKGKWRWTRYRDGGQELYNLEEDPREYNNLLGTEGRLNGGLRSLV